MTSNQPLTDGHMERRNETRFQYGLASLFWLTLAVAVVLGSWRIGWWKVAACATFLIGVLFCVVWASFIFDELRR